LLAIAHDVSRSSGFKPGSGRVPPIEASLFIYITLVSRGGNHAVTGRWRQILPLGRNRRPIASANGFADLIYI